MLQTVKTKLFEFQYCVNLDKIIIITNSTFQIYYNKSIEIIFQESLSINITVHKMAKKKQSKSYQLNKSKTN